MQETITMEKIIGDHPRLYSKCKYIECKSGWFPMIYKLSSEIEKMIPKDQPSGWETYANQVKEKYGGLRFYISVGNDAIFSIIEEYEEKSKSICEECSAHGATVKKNGWISTLCQSCYMK